MLTLSIIMTVVAAVVLVISVIADRIPLMYVSATLTILSGLTSLLVSHL